MQIRKEREKAKHIENKRNKNIMEREERRGKGSTCRLKGLTEIWCITDINNTKYKENVNK